VQAPSLASCDSTAGPTTTIAASLHLNGALLSISADSSRAVELKTGPETSAFRECQEAIRSQLQSRATVPPSGRLSWERAHGYVGSVKAHTVARLGRLVCEVGVSGATLDGGGKQSPLLGLLFLVCCRSNFCLLMFSADQQIVQTLAPPVS
jgi:hypothetical protein